MHYAMITGAGSGLGRATALALNARGCALALVDIDEAATAEVARACNMRASSCRTLPRPAARRQR